MPPYAVAALFTIGVGFVADRTQQRGLCSMAVAPLGVIGFALLLSDVRPGVKYFATFLAVMGIYPCVPNTAAWIANNHEGVYKRGTTIGIAMGWANLQGCVISNVYRGADAPRFIPGHAVVLGYLAVGLLGGSALHYILLRRENRLKLAGARNHLIQGKSLSEIKLMGDKR